METVAFDEAGNSGGNLLDGEQPVFALASVCLPQSDAEALVRSLLSSRQASELKFGRLSKRGGGQALIKEALESDLLSPETVRVSVAHKRWMLAGKIVDLLIEPGIAERGLSNEFYASGTHVKITDALSLQAPDELGSESWDKLQTAFQAASRDPSDAHLKQLERALARARTDGNGTAAAVFLNLIPASASELAANLVGGPDQLDPAVTALSEQLQAWSERLGVRFRVLHDASNTVAGSLADLLAFSRPSIEPSEMVLGDVRLVLPQLVDSIELAVSSNAPAVQLADLVAGAAAYCLKDELAGDGEEFAGQLRKIGIGGWVEHFLGPPGFGASLRAPATP